ncbi:hypothetical protein T484DRAFT_1931976 [Baffinella frigidus]|nr:hypothetical protein T484DRAFT_1931976 [Cryptophyta sp. CCMP2293]|mmetsp:Transcript_51661/g.117829  ORF Transcript_51661/g.117829 Transcript_51661/m.117829 type:complete len:213 (-) Transcript_51661:87-725(-)
MAAVESESALHPVSQNRFIHTQTHEIPAHASMAPLESESESKLHSAAQNLLIQTQTLEVPARASIAAVECESEAKKDGPVFNARITQLMREATLSTALAVASRAGLLSELCADSTPATPLALAARSNMEERHARELLGCLSSGGLVSCGDSEDEETYSVEEKTRAALLESGRLFQALLLDRFDAATAFGLVETRGRRVTNLISSMECEVKSA